MSWCEPVEVNRSDAGVAWVCKNCGRGSMGRDLAEHFPDRIFRPCTGTSSTPRKSAAWSAAEAHVKWLAAGCPVRSEAEIQEAFEICHSCNEFEPHASKTDCGTCGLCGCHLKRAGGILNKIRMATEHCPIEKW